MWQFTETLGEGAYGEYGNEELKNDFITITLNNVDDLELFWQKMSIRMNLLLSK